MYRYTSYVYLLEWRTCRRCFQDDVRKGVWRGGHQDSAVHTAVSAMGRGRLLLQQGAHFPAPWETTMEMTGSTNGCERRKPWSEAAGQGARAAVKGKCQTVWRDQSWRGEKKQKPLTEQPDFTEGLLVEALNVLTRTTRRNRTRTKCSFLRLTPKRDVYISGIFWFSAPRRRLWAEQTSHRFQRPVKENRLQNGLQAQCVFSSHVSIESRAFYLSQILWTISYFSWNPQKILQQGVRRWLSG